MINLSLPLPFPTYGFPPPTPSNSALPHVQPTHRCHHPRGSVCAGHFSTPELHPPNCNFVGHHSPRNTRIISPTHLHHANNPLDTLLAPTSSFHPFALFPSPHLLPHFARTERNETERNGTERTNRVIKGRKRREGLSVGRAERRRSPCVTRVCERASISASLRLTSPPLTAVSVLTEHRVEKGINRSGRYWRKEREGKEEGCRRGSRTSGEYPERRDMCVCVER